MSRSKFYDLGATDKVAIFNDVSNKTGVSVFAEHINC